MLSVLSAIATRSFARSLIRSSFRSYRVLQRLDSSNRSTWSLAMQMAQQSLVDAKWRKAQQLSAMVSPMYVGWRDAKEES